MTRAELPAELLWEDGIDGAHASELAVTAIADGEEALLPANVRQHVSACAECTSKLGEAAVLSMQTSRAVRELGPLVRLSPTTQPHSEMATRKRGLPVPMLLVAAVIAAAGSVPTLMRLPGRIVEFAIALTQTLPTLSRSGAQLVRSGLGPAWVATTCVSAVLLVMMSVAVTRLLPKPVSG